MRKYLSILVICIILVSFVYVTKNNFTSETFLDSVSLKEEVVKTNNSFAILVENDDGDYVEYTGSGWPVGRNFNSELSGCIDGDGISIENAISYNSDTNQVSVTSNGVFSCYLYFDMIKTLYNAILLAENNSDTVSEAITYIKSKGTPSFSSTATTDMGLYYAADDYGDSYYFRGAVTDNYVYFAGYYWRIIRINGDGSIRMIYDGTSAHSNATSTGYADRYISTSTFNDNYRSNASVGYMYGETYSQNSDTTSTTTTLSGKYYFGTGYTFDEDEWYYTLTDTIVTEFWSEDMVNYYTCFSVDDETCYELYYIVEYYDEYEGLAYYYADGEADPYDTEYYFYISEFNYYYATGYTFDEISGYVLSSPEVHIYDGTDALIDYYTCGNYSTSCTTMYQIVSVSSDTEADVTVYAVTTNDYATTHENKTNSTIKTVVDSWYYTNIYNKTDGTNSYDDYISDTLFCNDRSYTSGTGVGTTTTYYSAYKRLVTNKSPVLTCPQQNDAFTVSDTTSGNGDLTYKVGLITADEVAMAGGKYGTNNSSYYLYIGWYYWTMSPYYFSGSYAYEWLAYSSGSLHAFITSSMGVRPVVNLSSEVLVTGGDGTMDSPYEVALG